MIELIPIASTYKYYASAIPFPTLIIALFVYKIWASTIHFNGLN